MERASKMPLSYLYDQ
ncbi:hypothetical protein ACLADD_000048 [Escherichia coli]|nr:hypothetical protein [Escherichia coli]URE68467.1 hypothetical protein M7749_19045 [Escherichia coli]